MHRKLCLDSNCSFGKIVKLADKIPFMLCLDSNCSFGKISTSAGSIGELALP